MVPNSARSWYPMTASSGVDRTGDGGRVTLHIGQRAVLQAVGVLVGVHQAALGAHCPYACSAIWFASWVRLVADRSATVPKVPPAAPLRPWLAASIWPRKLVDSEFWSSALA